MQTQKVYIADYDSISPLGIGKDAILKSLLADYSAEKIVGRFDTSGLPFRMAAEVRDDLTDLYHGAHPKLLNACLYDRKLELTVSLYQFMKDRLHRVFDSIAPREKGIILGVGPNIAPLTILLKAIEKLNDTSVNSYIEALNAMICGKSLINPVLNPCDIYSSYLASELELFAFQKTLMTACAASAQAIAFGYDAIRHREVKAVLAGGVDSIINEIAFGTFSKLGVLAESGEEGVSALCKPFDVNRNGTLAGEAVGFCLMVGEDFIKESGIAPKFELLGYGNTLDAYKITAPDPTGKAMSRAIQIALDTSGIQAEDVDYINSHGTGTRANDEVELDAFSSVFEKAMKNIPLSSTKDRHGHAIAAAGIQEFSILCLCMENDFIPQTLNLKNPIAGPDYDLVMNENRIKKIKIGITNNFAFGGVNTVLVVKNLQH